MSFIANARDGREPNRLARLGLLGWVLFALVTLLAGVGLALQYSVGGCDFAGDASSHAVRLAVGFAVLALVAFAPHGLLMGLAYPAYVAGLVLLGAVEVFGETANEAERWITIGGVRFQPSEFMKLAIVFALARYYHQLSFSRARGVLAHGPALALILIPVLMIASQPDLGTALLATAAGLVVVFLSGVRWTVIAYGAVMGLIGVVMLYVYGLHPYQRERILTLFNPAADPMGAGYQSHQSIIAIGSGAAWGKGLCRGTQNQNDFVPENQTDFILAALAEEFGFVGGAGLLALTAAIIVCCALVSLRAPRHFGRLAALGVAANFALYVIINIGMVTGMLPVVGAPLPLLSYGGTVIIAVLAGFGLVLNVHVNRDVDAPRRMGAF